MTAPCSRHLLFFFFSRRSFHSSRVHPTELEPSNRSSRLYPRHQFHHGKEPHRLLEPQQPTWKPLTGRPLPYTVVGVRRMFPWSRAEAVEQEQVILADRLSEQKQVFYPQGKDDDYSTLTDKGSVNTTRYLCRVLYLQEPICHTGEPRLRASPPEYKTAKQYFFEQVW